MSCYHPLVGIDYGAINEETGKRKLKIVSGRNLDEVKSMYPDSVLIPCGKCIGCRMDYSRHWADRMLLELDTAGKGLFVTLTYDDDHLVNSDGSKAVGYGSLYKRHFQLFMKSLRKELDKYGIKIRFFAVGEYGDWKNTHRPHYHAILFGIGLSDLPDKKEVGFNELRQKVYTSSLISDHWPHGFISVGDVSWKSCAYVARYVTKKALDPSLDILNEKMGLAPLFSLMSRKPGIGRTYLEEHPDCLDWFFIPVSTSEGAKKVAIPKYFVKTLELTDPERYDKLIAERTLYASNAMYSRLSSTDDDMLTYLAKEEERVKGKILSLKRYI